MKVMVQWALRQAEDWQITEASEWSSFPFKPEPVGGETIDNSPGWIYALNVQGKIFAGYDHYHVEAIDDFVRVTVWNDDPVDWPDGTQCAEVWDCHPIGPDATKRGAINTRFRVSMYESEPERLTRSYRSADDVPFPVLPWADFQPPTSNIRHGIWISDGSMRQHNAAQTLKAWWSREWTTHLDRSEVDADGDLLPQRTQGRYLPSEHTITWYWTTDAAATSAFAAEEERALSQSVGSGSITCDIAADQASGTQEVSLASPANDPNVASWPSGNYRVQMDIATIGTAIIASIAAPIFFRLDSTLASQVTSRTLSTSDITTTGLKLLSGAWTPSGSTASDRLLLLIHAGNTNMMTATSIVFTCDADAFVDGPWTSGATPINATPSDANAFSDLASAQHNFRASIGDNLENRRRKAA